MEIWRDIDGYDGLYQISNLGKVKNLNYKRTGKPQILKYSTDKDGYLKVILSKCGKLKTYSVHRLVASAFISNPNNYNEVNHINEDKTDNRVENLEWCNRGYNVNYGNRNERVATALSKPVYSINKTTNEIIYYQSTIDAERLTGIYHSVIYRCCNGIYKSAGGYKWHYVN